MKQAFLKTDEDLRAGECHGKGSKPADAATDPKSFNDPSGCTSVTCLITLDGRIICVSWVGWRLLQILTIQANAGDSRSVLSYRGEAKALSHDHKPTNPGETARITAAGGFVEFNRVNGVYSAAFAIIADETR